MRDYDELIKDLREYAELVDRYMWDCPYMIADSMKQAADAIAELLPSAQQEQQWIPCKDRLPEEGVDVLISYRYKEGEGDTSHMYIDIASYGPVSFGGHKIEGIKQWGQPFAYFASNYEVVAWMPLPEPYEEHSMEEFMYGQDPGDPEDGRL